jgi:hypothetical protein
MGAEKKQPAQRRAILSPHHEKNAGNYSKLLKLRLGAIGHDNFTCPFGSSTTLRQG